MINPDKILFIMPTRGRMASALEAIGSVLKTARRPELLEFRICQDWDDEPFTLRSRNIHTIVMPRMRFVQWVNFAIRWASIDFGRVAWLTDDIRFRTQAWDVMVRERKELVVYGRDGIRNRPTHPFIRVELQQSLGYILPKQLIHQYPDTFIEKLATEIPSIYFDERLETEHLHYTVSKSKIDDNYRDSEKLYHTDRETFHNVILPTIPAIAEKVRNSIAGSDIHLGTKIFEQIHPLKLDHTPPTS